MRKGYSPRTRWRSAPRPHGAVLALALGLVERSVGIGDQLVLGAVRDGGDADARGDPERPLPSSRGIRSASIAVRTRSAIA